MTEENMDTSEGIKGLRDKLKSVEQENKELKSVVKILILINSKN